MEASSTIRRSSKNVVVDELCQRITAGVLSLHSRLPPERHLCEELGVGRSVLRSALRVMEAEGLIWRHVGKGTFVGGRPASVLTTTPLATSRGALHELLESRQVLEPAAARLAAKRAQNSDLVLLNRYQQLAAEAGDWSEYLKWDELFHRAVAEATANTFIISMMDCIIKTRCSPRWSNVGSRHFSASLQSSFSDQHDRICKMIASYDSAGAERAMMEHMQLISAEFGPMLAGASRTAS